MDDGKYIFLSYSNEDLIFARRLRDDLVNVGFNIWMDKTHIPGGHHWDDTIEEALEKTEVMVLLISPDSVKSQPVRDEMDYALDDEHKIPIVPVMYRDVKLPLRWRRLQYIVLHEDNYEKNLPIVIDEIQHALDPDDHQTDDKHISSPEPEEEKTKSVSFSVIFGIFVILVLLISLVLWMWSKNKIETKHVVVSDSTTPVVLQKKSVSEKSEINSTIQERQIQPAVTVDHTKNQPQMIVPEKKQPIEPKKQVKKTKQNLPLKTPHRPKPRHVKQVVVNTPVKKVKDHKTKPIASLPAKPSGKVLDIEKFKKIPYDEDGVVTEFIQKLNHGEPVVLQIINYKKQDDTYNNAFSEANNIAYLLRDRGLKRRNLEVKVVLGRGSGIVYKIVKEVR